ncbi:hypothetical protein Vretimale_16354 [Volvox reticuliferus]|uniref:Uncharacterized protein n=1 Tax=Volvox reticuliferus TaxID=1737510 RepID=A0A8J4LX87_9CHLO|nr:hypothetical protein Vretifemale_17861 [Volvox reticuliferus]GIM13251.1 hypothetical protein Vretimale_16354 [Volvox reticuliferus]
MLRGHIDANFASHLRHLKPSEGPAQWLSNTGRIRQAVTAPTCCRGWHLHIDRRSCQDFVVKSALNEHNNSIKHYSPAENHNYSRRTLLLRLVAIGSTTAFVALHDGQTSPAAALPLGPLGSVKRVGGDKQTGLSAEEVAEVLRRDLAEGQYFVTGNLTREVFADDCRFIDPANDVTGLSKYLTALGVLFDPHYSKVELLDIRVAGPRTVEADWRLGGYLLFPWNPRVEPFTGHTVYTLNDEGLVLEQRQTWSISATTALIESFTPTLGPRRKLF